MKKTIIVTTDFTDSSRNALSYACEMAADSSYKLLLVHVYTMPANYASDGVALAAVKEAFDTAEDKLTDEMEWVLKTYPLVTIEGKATIGGLVASLTDLIQEVHPEMLFMGAANDYASLWEWDSEILSALTNLPIPVLVIPKQISYTAIKKIGFACDYRNLCTPIQINFIKRLTAHTGAQLLVVHIARSKPENEEVKKKNEALLQEMLKDIQPEYYAIEDPNVIDAAAHFVKDHNLDLLMVIPHKHDIWYSIFHQSHTRQLAKLNNMPILSLPE